MIGEAFEGITWGNNIKARNAASTRFIDLKEQGYEVFWATKSFGLVGNRSYYVLAFSPNEDFDLIKPALPESNPRGRRLNVRTITVGMTVAIEHVQGEEITGDHNRRGNVQAVWLDPQGIGFAKVLFQGRKRPETIQVFRLRQVAR